MEVIKVGIFLDDKSFGEALATGLAREAGGMRFYLLNSPEEGEFCDMLLVSKSTGDDRMVEMVRDPDAQNCRGEPPYRVYRYRESSNLMNDLLFIYFKLTGKVVEIRNSASCRTVAFLAESGGCGTTSTALGTARMLYQIYGSRSLYLNLCPIDDSRQYPEETGEESLLNLLYYLEQNRQFPLSSFITETEELDYVNTGVINTYFNEMKPVLMQRFLQKVDQLGRYDFLIVDMGNHLCIENKKLLKSVDCAVLIRDGERRREEEIRRKISREIMNRVKQGRLLCVKNFADDRWSEEDAGQFCITRQESRDLRLVKNYGSEIAALAKEIMEGKSDGREQ